MAIPFRFEGYCWQDGLISVVIIRPTALSSSEKLKVVQLVAILHDVLLDLAAHSPGDEVFHAPRYQESRVADLLNTASDVPLLDKLCSSLDGFRHAQAMPS